METSVLDRAGGLSSQVDADCRREGLRGLPGSVAVAYQQWLRRQRFTEPALATACDTALETVRLTADRRDRSDKVITTMAGDPAWSAIVTRLPCVRRV